MAIPLLARCSYFALPMPEDPGPASVRVEAPSPIVTDDRGASVTFTVALGTKPLADVQLTLTVSDESAATVEPSVLSFSGATWDAPQTVTVRGVVDTVRRGDRGYAIVFAPALSADARYAGFVAPALGALAIDGEEAGVIVSPATGVVTTEAGRGATLSVRLRSAPVTDVVVSVATSVPTEAMVQPAQLVFTPSSWSTPQAITVTGLDDGADDGDREYEILLGPTESADPGYDGVPCDPVAASNLDDERAGYIITTPPGGLVTTEAGGTATFTIALQSAPTAPVTVAFSSNDPGEGTVTDAVLLTPDDWDTPHVVTVRGVDDGEVDGNQPYDIVGAGATSDDLRYAGLAPPPVGASNVDDDIAGIRVTPQSLVTSEAGGVAVVEIVLEARPDADVTISIFSSNTAEGTVTPGSVTFTPSSWSVPVTVLITPVDDAIADGPRAYTIVTVPAITADPRYAGRDAPNVEVVNQDND